MTGFNHLNSPQKSERVFVSFCPAVKRSGMFLLFLLCNSIWKKNASRRGLSNSTSSPPSPNVAARSLAQTPLPLTHDVTVIQSNQRLETVWVSAARRVAKNVCQEKEKKKDRKNKGNQRLPALPSSRGFICLAQDSGGKKTAAECQNPSLRKSHLLSEDGWAAERSFACLSSVSPLPGDAG